MRLLRPSLPAELFALLEQHVLREKIWGPAPVGEGVFLRDGGQRALDEQTVRENIESQKWPRGLAHEDVEGFKITAPESP